MQRWYVAHTQPNAEAKAVFHLERQGFTAYLPRYLKQRRHARRTEIVPASVFPRYLFVAMDLEAARWRAIRSTIGVSHLVCNGDRPMPVPHGIVEDIRARQDEHGYVILGRQIPFRQGDAVRIGAGAFADQVGLFECMSDEERVVLLLELLGRQVRITVPLDAIVAYG